MSKKSFIDSVEVRVPCEARWEDMTGNDRVRFCDHCAKEVNNLSAMTRKEATRLVRAADGRLCIRYVPDASSHPIFADRLIKITRHHPRIAAGVLSASIGLQSMSYAQSSDKQTDPAAIVAEQEKKQKDYETAIERAGTTGGVEGMIVDEQGAGVGNVHIMVNHSGDYGGDDAVTDQTGHFGFKELDPGEYIIRILSSNGSWKRAAPTITVIAANATHQDLSVRVVHNEPDGTGEGGAAGGVGMGGAMAYIPYSLPLTQAVDEGDTGKVKQLLDSGARVNGREPAYSNITPLFVAVEKGDVEIVRLLIRYGAKVDARDTTKRTPLMAIDDDATPELVKLLIDSGASVSAKDTSGTSVIFAAVDTGKPEVLSAIVRAGADINAPDNAKITPLMHAVENGKVDMVNALIAFGADVNATNEGGLSAWELSFDSEIDALLLAAGASVNYAVTVDPSLTDDESQSEETDNDQPSPTPEPTPPLTH